MVADRPVNVGEGTSTCPGDPVPWGNILIVKKRDNYPFLPVEVFLLVVFLLVWAKYRPD